jgi:diguanylate cyclase (GGDEF)-like protein
MADLDNFKTINDTFGHSAGDIVLKKFGEFLMDNIRRCDMCARIGGEEFLIILTHVDQEGVVRAIEHVRRVFETYTFTFSNGSTRVTASFGIAGLPPGVQMGFDDLVAKADSALYAAKNHGRNKVELAQLEEPATGPCR